MVRPTEPSQDTQFPGQSCKLAKLQYCQNRTKHEVHTWVLSQGFLPSLELA